jgi:hypothetical protein
MFVSVQLSDDNGRTWAMIVRVRDNSSLQFIVSDLQTGGEVQTDEKGFLQTLFKGGFLPLSSGQPAIKPKAV